MLRPQFSLKTPFVLMTLSVVVIVFGKPYWHKYAPAWGEPTLVAIDDDWAEARYWTGRQEIVAIGHPACPD